MFKTLHTAHMDATRWSEKILHLKGRAALNDGKVYRGDVRYACCDRWRSREGRGALVVDENVGIEMRMRSGDLRQRSGRPPCGRYRGPDKME